MKGLMGIILILSFYTSDGFTMYHTNMKTSSGYDCLYYSHGMGAYESDTSFEQLMPYCIRPFLSTTHQPVSKHPYLTFADLKMNGVSSAQLIEWLAPIDVAENYEIYLLNTREFNSLSSYRYFNCSSDHYGPQCEYFFPDSFRGDFSDMVNHLFLVKNRAFQPASTVPCYTHLSCIRGPEPLCLDWREVCDGKKDCANGEDEVDCWQIEANICTEKEYQCYSGHCIPDHFYQDEIYSPDCADGSDESDFDYDDCATKPTFRCEEHTCYSSWGTFQFACGDGQCITKFGECVNKRKDTSFLDETSSQSNLSYDCWKPMTCLTGYFLDTDGRDCGDFCWGTCAEKIVENCPEYIQFPSHAVVSDHLYLVYARDTADVQKETIGNPMYICYDIDKCANELRPFTTMFGRRCLYFDKLNITWSPPYIWTERIAIIARTFSSICESTSVSFQCANKTPHQCSNTKKCISIRRLVDGIIDCEEGDDEVYTNSCSLSDVSKRFRCSQEEKCLSQRMVNNGKEDCKGADDEVHPYKRLSRQLISFPTICDGFQELEPILIDGQKETDETDCEMWRCNNTYTNCDGIWNCKDGADEIGCVKYSLQCPPLHHHCVNRTTGQITCLPLSMVNNGEIDCLGGSDEVRQCQDLINGSCSLVSMLKPQCYYQLAIVNFRCWNDTKCIDKTDMQCQDLLPCPSGKTESKLLCDYIAFKCSSRHPNNLTDVEKLFCALKKNQPKWSYRHFQLSERPPANQLSTPALSRSFNREKRQFSNVKDIWPCHRGIPTIVYYNYSAIGKTKCFCPPSYFGDFCEYQSERVSLSIQIQMSAEWSAAFTFVYYLINDLGEIESHDQLHYMSVNYCKAKVNRYLLYSSRPKNSSRTYSVHFEAYDRQKLEYRASWCFPLRFSFLPVERLAIQLRVPLHHIECLLDCGAHGQCASFINTGDLFCRCDSGWTGQRCEQPRQINCNCAPNSLCLFNQICICPLGKHGQRCYLSVRSCSELWCNNNSTCVHLEPRSDHVTSSFMCLCSNGFAGHACRVVLRRIIISFHDLVIPSLILLHFIEVIENKPHQRIDTFKKIPLDHETISIYISSRYQMLFAEFLDNYYLIYLENSGPPSTTEVKLNPQYRCSSIRQVFNETFSSLHLLRRIKYYHVPCQIYLQLHCFYDEYHMCLCDDDRRANCLTFEHNKTYACQGNYGDCENGAQCFQDKEDCPSSAACLCPRCYYGSKCQFSTQGFAISLEAILGYHIRPRVRMASQPLPVKITVGLTTIIFSLGTISSFLSILTFHMKETRTVGCGLYLLEASFSSLLSVWIFTWNCLFLLLSQMQIITNHLFLLIQCISSEFLLQFFLSFGDWLIAFVAVERATAVLQGIYFKQSKSKQIAKRSCVILLFFTICTTIHDPFHRQLMKDEDEQRTWCIVRYSTNFRILNRVIHLFHFLVPFTINLISALIIVTLTARSRTNISQNISFKQNLVKQFYTRKHLLISPVVLVILALPRLIIVFLSDCMTSARDPYLFLAAYFTSIIPSLLIFFVFVLTSKMYKKASQESIQKFRVSLNQFSSFF